MEKISAVNKDIKLEHCEDAHSSSNLINLPSENAFGPNDAPLNAQVCIIKQDPEIYEFLPIEVNVDNKQLEHYCDEHLSSNLMNVPSKHTLGPNDASLNAEICIIEKQDPELCNADVVEAYEGDKYVYEEEDNDIDVSDYEFANYDKNKCVYVDENAQCYPIKLEGKNLNTKVIDPFKSKSKKINLKNASSKQNQKRNKQNQRNSVFKRFFKLLCPYCGIEIKNTNTWKKHVNRAHNFEKSLQQYTFIDKFRKQCNECKVVVKAKPKQILQAHTISHMPHNQIYKCNICTKRCTCEVDIRSHLEAKHVNVRSILLARGFDVEHPKDMDNDAAADSSSDTPNNVQKFQSNEIANKLNSQRTQDDSVFSGRKTKLQKNEDSLQKYIIHLCPVCGIDCGQLKKNWYSHINNVHNLTNNFEKSYTLVKKYRMQCHECKIVLRTANKYELLRHSITHLPYKKILKCKICAELRAWDRNMLGHIEREHLDIVRGKLPSVVDNIENKYCVFCEKHLGHKDKLLEHMQKKHKWICKNKIQFICPVSGIKFSGERLYRLHINKVHKFDTLQGLSFEEIAGDVIDKGHRGKMKYRCIKCDLLFPTCQMSILKAHAITHLPHQTYKCRYCDYSDSSRQKLIKHICKELLDAYKGNELLNKYRCVQMKLTRNKRSDDKTIFVKNWHTCSNFAKCQCPLCGFIDENNEDIELVHHLKHSHSLELQSIEHLNFKRCADCTTNENQMNYKCLECNQLFTDCSITQLQEHNLSHSFYRMWHCTLCTFKCNTKAMLLCHVIKWHIKQKKKRFFRPYKLFSARRQAISYKEKCIEKVGNNDKKINYSYSNTNNTENIGLVDDARKLTKQKILNSKDKYIGYACPECNVPLANEELWYMHISDQHRSFGENLNIKEVLGPKLIRLCLECNKEVRGDSWARELHKMQHLPYRSFICKICRYRFKSKGSVLKHLYNKHFSAVELKCDICSQVCTTHYDFFTHMKTQHTNIAMWPENICPICVEFFADGNNVNLHIKTKYSTDDIEEYEKETESKLILKSALGEQSGLVIKNEGAAPPVNYICAEMILPTIIPSDSQEISSVGGSQVLTSMATCSSKSTSLNKYCPYMTYACPDCNIPLPTQKEWHFHITTKHDFFAENALNIKDIPGEAHRSICLECNSKMSSRVLIKQRHKLTHMPYRSFICIICLHRSRNQSVLFEHMKRKHFTPGKYTCEMCALIFKTDCERFTHAKSEHKDIEWPINVCRICVSTINTSRMQEHIKTHNYDREQFPCSCCKKIYFSVYERIRHMREQHPLEFNKEQLELPATSKKKRGRPKKNAVSESDPDYK